MMRNCEMWLVPHANTMLSCEMRSVPHANEGQGTSNALGNWRRQWTSIGLADVKVDMFDNQLCTLMSESQRLSERDCSKPLTKMHSVIQIWTFLHIYSKCMGFEQLQERGLFCVKNAVFPPVYLQPLQQVILLRGLGLSPKVLAHVVVTKWNFQNLFQDYGITCLVECLSSAGSA